jgi:hypothetical protein
MIVIAFAEVSIFLKKKTCPVADAGVGNVKVIAPPMAFAKSTLSELVTE